MPLYCLSQQDRREAFQAARCALSREDQVSIELMAARMVKAIKAKHPAVGFSIDNALEVLAGLGMFLNRRQL